LRRKEKHAEIWWRNYFEDTHLEDQETEHRLTLKLISVRQVMWEGDEWKMWSCLMKCFGINCTKTSGYDTRVLAD
jgi:hypothetical protein